MNMGFTKSIKVFTIVIIVLIIIVKNSNASLCTKQIKDFGGMEIDYNGTQAFKHAFLTLNTRNTKQKDRIYLSHYFQYLYKSVRSKCDSNTFKGPFTWCIENIAEIKHIKNTIRMKIICESEFKSAGFQNSGDGLTALDYVFNNLRGIPNKRLTLAIKYVMYLLDECLQLVEKLQLRGPKAYCENYVHHIGCFDQMVLHGGLSMDMTGSKALLHFYTYHMVNTITGENKEILYEYWIYLFKSAMANYQKGTILSPMGWCMTYKISNDNENFCKVFMDKSDFKSTFTDVEALYYGYSHTTIRQRINDTKMAYFAYLLEKFTICLNKWDLKGPKEYCNDFNSKSAVEGQNDTASSSHLSVDPSQSNEIDAKGKKLAYNPNESDYSPLENTSVKNAIGARGKELAYNPNESVYLPLENTFIEGHNWISNPSSGSTSAPGYMNPVNTIPYGLSQDQIDNFGVAYFGMNPLSTSTSNPDYNNSNDTFGLNEHEMNDLVASFDNKYKSGQEIDWNSNPTLLPTYPADQLYPVPTDQFYNQSYQSGQETDWNSNPALLPTYYADQLYPVPTDQFHNQSCQSDYRISLGDESYNTVTDPYLPLDNTTTIEGQEMDWNNNPIMYSADQFNTVTTDQIHNEPLQLDTNIPEEFPSTNVTFSQGSTASTPDDSIYHYYNNYFNF